MAKSALVGRTLAFWRRASAFDMKDTADVVIVGGGCMGASTAYHLTRLGVTDVVIVEREPMLGTGSTGRNAGGVRHQFSHPANVKLSLESIRVLERFRDEVGYETDFHQHGYLFLLSTDESLSSFRENVGMQRRLGVDVALLTPEEAVRLAPGLKVDGILGATFCSRDGIADPNGVTMGFARGAQARGARILRDTEVTQISVENGGVQSVRTTSGEIETRVVVNAAGPYARRIGDMAELDIPVMPYRRHIFITEGLGPGAAGHEAPDSRIMVVDFETTFYFHREGGGVLFGMSDPDEPSSYDLTVGWEVLEKVTPVAIRRLPILGELGIAHAWAGLYEVTPDAMPIIGGTSQLQGFFMINGFSGHGFQHSPAAGRILADIITGRDPGDVSPFSFERFSRSKQQWEINVV